MSIATEISRIQTDRNTIRAKLVELGMAQNTDELDKLAAAIEKIENRGAVSAMVQEGDTYTIPKGYHNGSGTVSGVAGGGNYNLQSKTVTPTKLQQNVTPDSGFYGLSDVTVSPIPEAYSDVSAVTVTMGGTDVTADVYSDGVISIPRVTGDITVTAAASKPVYYTNQVPNAVDSSGNPAPYQDGYSLSSSGTASAYGSAYTCTGFIPLADGSSKHVYRIAGDGITFSKSDEYHRIAWYDAKFALLKTVIPAKRIDFSAYFPSSVPESTTAMTIKVTDSTGAVVSNVPANAAYFPDRSRGQGGQPDCDAG